MQTVTNYAMYIWYRCVNDDENADLRGPRAASEVRRVQLQQLVEVAREKTAALSATFNAYYDS